MATTEHAMPTDLPPAMIEGATALADWVIVAPLILALGGASLLLLMRNWERVQATFSTIIVLAIIVSDYALMQRVFNEGPLTMTMGKWLPPFGISFTADTLGAMLALTSAFIVLFIIIFAQRDMSKRETHHGFYPLILLLLAGISGSFLTGDLFNLYVWFELMLISTFGLLIMGGRRRQLDGAVKYGFMNFMATTFFLIATAYLYGTIGTLNMADILIKVRELDDPGTFYTIGAIFLMAFGMKAAAFPLNTWLPASYHTTSPVVSALFAGLLTKVGVYALIRTLALLLPEALGYLSTTVAVVAGITMILGPLGAMAQIELRRALGFLVIGGVGVMLAGLAFGSSRGLMGASFYAVHSMLTMSALFLVAGLIEHAGKTGDVRKLGGFYATNSTLSILFLVLVFSASGLPPFLGFWPKLTLVQTGLEMQNTWLTVAILLNGFLTAIAGARLWAHIFLRAGPFGTPDGTSEIKLEKMSDRERWFGLIPVSILTACIVALGLWPQPLFERVMDAANGLNYPTPYIESVFGGGDHEGTFE